MAEEIKPETPREKYFEAMARNTSLANTSLRNCLACAYLGVIDKSREERKPFRTKARTAIEGHLESIKQAEANPKEFGLDDEPDVPVGYFKFMIVNCESHLKRCDECDYSNTPMIYQDSVSLGDSLPIPIR